MIAKCTQSERCRAGHRVSILGGFYVRVDPEQALRVMKRELLRLEMPNRSEG